MNTKSDTFRATINSGLHALAEYDRGSRAEYDCFAASSLTTKGQQIINRRYRADLTTDQKRSVVAAAVRAGY